jgi:hypothetical protein
MVKPDKMELNNFGSLELSILLDCRVGNTFWPLDILLWWDSFHKENNHSMFPKKSTGLLANKEFLQQKIHSSPADLADSAFKHKFLSAIICATAEALVLILNKCEERRKKLGAIQQQQRVAKG